MPRIMLVDDEINVLRSLRRCIHDMPAATFDGDPIVEVFEKPAEALLRAKECEFDLVVTDWRMPFMNGLEFLNRLLRIQPDIVRMVLSGYSEFRSEVEAIERLKIFHFITKPWNNDELGELFRLALEQRNSSPATRSQLQRAYKREAIIGECDLQAVLKAA